MYELRITIGDDEFGTLAVTYGEMTQEPTTADIERAEKAAVEAFECFFVGVDAPAVSTKVIDLEGLELAE